MITVVTKGGAETVELGARLGRLLEPGDFIELEGDLGAGKTQFAKGIAAGLEVDPSTPVTSPTYTILNIYNGRIPLYHFDLYRLADADEVESLGFEEYFSGAGVCVLEWPERLGEEKPHDVVTITFAHGGDDTRTITFTAHGARAVALLGELFPGES